MKQPLQKGQVALLGVVIGAVATVMASGLAAWGSASARNAELEGDVRVVEERENNHYAETQKQLEQMNQKLDALLKSEGLTLKK